MPQDGRAIAISATFTAEAIQPTLVFWMAELGLDYEIRFAGYNQVFQELLDPGGLLARNTGFNVLLVRFEDWLDGQAQCLVEAQRLVEALRASVSPAQLVLAICPSPGEFAAAERTVREGTADLAAVHVITPEEIAALYPVAEVHDPHANQLGHVPYTPVFFVALATAIARKIHAIRMAPYKVIALDCDDTLWAGICGEDGPQGVVVDPPRLMLQEFMAARRREGMLLALCSKNNDPDVVETFQAHPAMPLRLADFAARRVNWESKGANLVSLAQELDLGLDSFILVDDNPKECTEAQTAAPEALALALPEKAAEIPAFLRHVWAFDRARVTAEDRKRPEIYAQRAERARAERVSANLEEFLAELQLEIQIAALEGGRAEAGQVERVAQLTQRTNQMNTTCMRRSAAEIQRLLGRGAAECLTVRVQDRFGSYGLTGVMVFRTGNGALVVDTFLLSCRVLGRGVEHRMVARLGELAVERGLARVEIPFVAGQRNRPAALFLESLKAKDADAVFRFGAAEAAAVRYRPGTAAGNARTEALHETGIEAPVEAAHRRSPEPVPYWRIAMELRDAAQILERIRAAAQRGALLREWQREVAAPRTTLERALAELWAELLNLPVVGIHDNFFELGGHSLLAVQLLSRVRQIYGVELSLEVVYSSEFTVAELAKAVELKEIEQGGEDYQDLLQELEAMSDEEARALLAEEQDAT